MPTCSCQSARGRPLGVTCHTWARGSRTRPRRSSVPGECWATSTRMQPQALARWSAILVTWSRPTPGRVPIQARSPLGAASKRICGIRTIGWEGLAGPPLAAMAGGVIDEDQAQVLGVPHPPRRHPGHPTAHRRLAVGDLGAVTATPPPPHGQRQHQDQAEHGHPGDDRHPDRHRNVQLGGGGAEGHHRAPPPRRQAR